jgi:hypothetical protein
MRPSLHVGGSKRLLRCQVARLQRWLASRFYNVCEVASTRSRFVLQFFMTSTKSEGFQTIMATLIAIVIETEGRVLTRHFFLRLAHALIPHA